MAYQLVVTRSGDGRADPHHNGGICRRQHLPKPVGPDRRDDRRGDGIDHSLHHLDDVRAAEDRAALESLDHLVAVRPVSRLEAGLFWPPASFGTILFIGLAALAQIRVWDAGDKRFAARGHTMETATGLGSIGKVRMYEPPHTGTNYLLTEMVYVVARKHAIKLRIIAFAFSAYVAPMIMAMTAGWQFRHVYRRAGQPHHRFTGAALVIFCRSRACCRAVLRQTLI